MMKSLFILLFVLGVLGGTCISLVKSTEIEAKEELAAAQMKILENHLYNIQQAAKVHRITFVINELIDTSGPYPQTRCIRSTPNGALLERVREILGSLKINPHYKGAKRNPIFEKWSPSIEINAIPNTGEYYTTDGEKHEFYASYCILVDSIGQDSTSLYYLDAEKTSELRMIIKTIWKNKIGQDPPINW